MKGAGRRPRPISLVTWMPRWRTGCPACRVGWIAAVPEEGTMIKRVSFAAARRSRLIPWAAVAAVVAGAVVGGAEGVIHFNVLVVLIVGAVGAAGAGVGGWRRPIGPAVSRRCRAPFRPGQPAG